MKLIKNIKYGTKPVSKIYFNNQIIYEKSSIKVLITSQSIINTLLTASPEIVYNIATSILHSATHIESTAFPETIISLNECGDSNIIDGSIATLELATITPTQLGVTEDILSITCADTIHTDLSSIASIAIFNKCAPNTNNIIDTNGESQLISIKASGSARSRPVAYAFTVDKINDSVISNAKSAPTIPINNCQTQINIRNKASAHSVREVEASMFDQIVMTNKLVYENTPQILGSSYDIINIEAELTTDETLQNDLISHNVLKVEALSNADTSPTVSTEGHNVLTNIKNISNAILWQYPKNTDNYWLIVQAYQANTINDETLEVI